MSDLATNYMGLELRNPLIVASSSLSKNIDGVKKLADAGAGAVVLKSLFEEQIQKEIVQDAEQYTGPSWHQEAHDYVNRMGMELGPAEYLKLIEKAKKAVSIPIIPSLNCVSPQWWKDYAKQIELAGADAIELNIAYMAADISRSSAEIEQVYHRVLERIKGTVGIPIAVKIGPYFSSLGHIAYALWKRGASAIVFFNRFYQFDVDVERERVVAGNPLSTPGEMSLSLRWIAQLAGRIECALVASTGIHNALAVIKQIMVGATAVELCSVLFEKGVKHLTVILGEIENWMKKHGHSSLDAIRGKLSKEMSANPELYERLQYIKALVGIE